MDWSQSEHDTISQCEQLHSQSHAAEDCPCLKVCGDVGAGKSFPGEFTRHAASGWAGIAMRVLHQRIKLTISCKSRPVLSLWNLNYARNHQICICCEWSFTQTDTTHHDMLWCRVLVLFGFSGTRRIILRLYGILEWYAACLSVQTYVKNTQSWTSQTVYDYSEATSFCSNKSRMCHQAMNSVYHCSQCGVHQFDCGELFLCTSCFKRSPSSTSWYFKHSSATSWINRRKCLCGA